MKIGTVTFWDSEDNYGQLLQCFALLKFLKQNGYDPFLIKFKRVRIRSKLPKRILIGIKMFMKNPKEFLKTIRFLKQQLDSEKKYVFIDRKFSQFREKYIPSTKAVYTETELFINPPLADVYICGSDQIWSGGSPTMFLQFVPKNKKRIAYAASFGGSKPANLDEVSIFLKTFDYVSLREKSGVELCKQLGCATAELVPDPTLLLAPNTYRDMIMDVQVGDEKYLLLYLLGNEIPISVDSIFAFAKSNNLKIKYVASQGRIDDYPKISPTIEEWIGLIDNATYVITNSFHGTVFCMLLNTPFLVIPLSGLRSKMNVRINDLLEKYGMKERIYKNTLDTIYNPVSFEKFNLLQESERRIIAEKMIEIIKK